MALVGVLRRVISSAVRPFGYELVQRELLYDWQMKRGRSSKVSPKNIPLPEGAAELLTVNNPRLRQLEELYAKADSAVTVPAAWDRDHVSPADLRYFRGDNAYVYQIRNMGEVNYVVTTLYVKTIDSLGLLQNINEDGAFGAHTFEVHGKVVSRDLLDSILEINFLERHVGLSQRTVSILDIGAGYGRLAHRVVEAFPRVQYYCTDAIAVSTFLCEYYLQYRGVDDRATVVPLTQLADLNDTQIDIAVNIHSFSECTLTAIEWWVQWLRCKHVRLLMIVPNVRGPMTNSRADFGHILEKHGYRQIVEEPKFSDPVVSKYAVYPSWRYLYELAND